MSLSVSVVLPVGYGARYFRLALNCFLNQTYDGPLDVLVLDNGAESIEHLVPLDARVKYARCPRATIGELRNKANALVTGDVIVNADEDDWYANTRVAEQVARLQVSGKAVTGWHDLLFYNTADSKCYRYNYGRPGPYATGTSLCYARSWWADHPFKAVPKGTDFWFQKEAADAAQLDSTVGGQLGVARAHRDSTCPPMFGGNQFPAVPREVLPEAFWRAIKSDVGTRPGAGNRAS